MVPCFVKKEREVVKGQGLLKTRDGVVFEMWVTKRGKHRRKG